MEALENFITDWKFVMLQELHLVWNSNIPCLNCFYIPVFEFGAESVFRWRIWFWLKGVTDTPLLQYGLCGYWCKVDLTFPPTCSAVRDGLSTRSAHKRHQLLRFVVDVNSRERSRGAGDARRDSRALQSVLRFYTYYKTYTSINLSSWHARCVLRRCLLLSCLAVLYDGIFSVNVIKRLKKWGNKL